MKTVIVAYVLAIACDSSYASAQPASREESVQLSGLIEKALSSNAELKGLEASLDAFRSQIKPAGTYEDPMLSVEMMNVPTDSFRLNESEMSGVQIALSQKIPYPGKLGMQQQIATMRAEALEHRIRQKRFELAWNVKRIYYELYLRFKKRGTLENERSFLQQTLATTRSRYALGQVSQASILNLQVEEAQLLNDQLRLSSEMKNLEAELAHISGHTDHAPRIEFQPIRIARVKLDSWTDKDVSDKLNRGNGEIQALSTELKASDASISLARKAYLPDFEVMASYTMRQEIPGMETAGRGQDMIGARIGVSLPIWGSAKQSEQIRQAVAEKEQSSHALENIRLMQVHEVKALFAELKESLQRIDLFESGLLRLSQQAVATGRAAYLSGKESYTTIVDALRRQQETEYGYEEALVAYQLQIAKLEALLGQNLEVQ